MPMNVKEIFDKLINNRILNLLGKKLVFGCLIALTSRLISIYFIDNINDKNYILIWLAFFVFLAISICIILKEKK